jgi:hypothetical protein
MIWRKMHRAFCKMFHRHKREPVNGFGWTGTYCRKCGFSFFGEWEEWAKEQ